ncbi:hypothetical protein C8F01DRAFT_1370608 [Mycena amicta]|nr:hypothetical protein C8F01DRAFT_1370608 [Mycena amicta]
MSVAKALVDLPQDIILTLARSLDIEGLVSLLSSCRKMRQLEGEATLWIHAILRIQTIQLHPVIPFATTVDDLATVPLTRLRECALRANRILRNLKAPNPKLLRFRTYSLDGGEIAEANVRFFIPGTPLLVLGSRGVFAIWNVLKQAPALRCEMEGLTLVNELAVARVPGVGMTCALVAGVVSDGSGVWKLVAFHVHTKDLDHPTVSRIVSPAIALTPDPLPFQKRFFLTSELVGFCTESSIVYWNMKENSPVHSVPNAFSGTLGTGNRTKVLSMRYDPPTRFLYAFLPGRTRSDSDAAVHWFPLPLPSSTTSSGATDGQSPMQSLSLPYRFPGAPNEAAFRALPSSNFGTFGVLAPVLVHPQYNVFAMTHRLYFKPTIAAERRSCSYLHFFTIRPEDSDMHDRDDEHDGAPKQFEPSICLELPESATVNAAVGHSGRYVFVHCGPRSQNIARNRNVGLVCLQPPAIGADARAELRSFVIDGDVEFPQGNIAIDDISGLVAVHKRNSVSIFSYDC